MKKRFKYLKAVVLSGITVISSVLAPYLVPYAFACELSKNAYILGGRGTDPNHLKQSDSLSLSIDGKILKTDLSDLIISDGGAVLISSDLIKTNFGLSVLEYPDGKIILQGGDGGNVIVSLKLNEAYAVRGQMRVPLDGSPCKIDDILYIPLDVFGWFFGYTYEIPFGSDVIEVTSELPDIVSVFLTDEAKAYRQLPLRYDYRDVGRAPNIKDQGEAGTCWSFAALTALESSSLPLYTYEYSEDHMSLRNSFALDLEEGGEYTMSMAYLLAWQGPVLEEEDPYGDGISPEGLTPAVHVEEILLPPEKDIQAIKEAVFLYGGVQSSMYITLENAKSHSAYYNEDTHAYCFNGEALPNHDLVIVGWDDLYPAENFATKVPGDGAFICMNSWGTEFGEDGYFYVSYYDDYIGEENIVYTKVSPADPDERIYQTDLCGWVGQIGYNREDVYGVNIYEAEGDESLYGAGFYATMEDTEYELYVATDFNINNSQDLAQGNEQGGVQASEQGDLQGQSSDNLRCVSSGILKASGFYTITWDDPIELEPGERFAVILYISTPKAIHPLAVEYVADEVTGTVNLTDGEGYISVDGENWESAEDVYACNLCLKAYTRKE